MSEIRQYNAKDLAACRQLWVILTDWHRDIYQSPGIGGSDPGKQFDEHLELVGPDNIWVAKIDGEIVGLTGLIEREGEAELEPLVINQSWRGQGIGRQLANTVIAAAQQRGIGQLTVRPVGRNAQAIQFFHEMGFTILGQIDLFMDFAPAERQVWQGGEQIAGRDFKV
ncbi:MAG: GNAT family N-acetyltransferase [Chloroflexi bacterium]|nr:GNAT family N-acetyltransferase [Chloroflexota bacterium]